MTRGVAIVGAVIMLAAAEAAGAAVFAWREGATLHLTNDPDSVPAERTPRRFETRVGAPGPVLAEGEATRARRAPAPARPPGAPPPWRAPFGPVPLAPPAPAALAAQAERPALVVAPTIVIRAAPPVVVLVRAGVDPYALSGFPFLPSGFIGHEHPQVPFLAAHRLRPHSHFFRRGRRGFFTPFGHFTHEGLLQTTVPY